MRIFKSFIINNNLLNERIYDSIGDLMHFIILFDAYREWVLTDNIPPARTAAQMMLESMPETLKQIFPGT